MRADLDAVPVPDDIRSLAEALDFDPWTAISEGTLLAAVDPGAAGGVRSALEAAGIPSWVLGRVAGTPADSVLARGGGSRPFPEPGEDPFWKLFFAGLE